MKWGFYDRFSWQIGKYPEFTHLLLSKLCIYLHHCLNTFTSYTSCEDFYHFNCLQVRVLGNFLHFAVKCHKNSMASVDRRVLSEAVKTCTTGWIPKVTAFLYSFRVKSHLRCRISYTPDILRIEVGKFCFCKRSFGHILR